MKVNAAAAAAATATTATATATAAAAAANSNALADTTVYGNGIDAFVWWVCVCAHACATEFVCIYVYV